MLADGFAFQLAFGGELLRGIPIAVDLPALCPEQS
jgi:hypothetical protein